MATNRDLRVRTGRSRRPADHARRVIGTVIRAAGEPVLFTDIRLTSHRALVLARASLELPGRTLSVRAEASAPGEAVDLLAEQLDVAFGDLRTCRSGSLGSASGSIRGA